MTTAAQADSNVKHTPHVFATLDGLRGIAALLVLIIHFGPFFGYELKFQDSFMAVDVFFLLSGAVVSHAYEERLKSGLSAWHFAYMRVVRIYPLYLLGCLIKLAAFLCAGVEVAGGGSHLLIFCVMALFMLPNFFFADPGTGKPNIYPMNGPSWSLFFELAANFFYAFTLRFLNMRAIVAILVLSALGNIACMYISPTHNLDLGWTAKNFPGGAFRVGYSFFMGVLLYRAYKRRHRGDQVKRGSFIPYIVLAAAAVMMMLGPPEKLEGAYDFICVTVLFPVLVYCGMVFQPAKTGAKICKFLGIVSYPVYILQNSLAFSSQEILRAVNHVTEQRALPFAGLDFVYNYAPWPGVALLLVLLPFTWWLNKVYDEPVRRYLLKQWRGKPGRKFAVARD